MTTTARKISAVLFGSVLFASAAYTEDDSQKTAALAEKYSFQTVTTKEGLKFNVPPDMPIQSRDGMVQPMEFDQYLYVKFKTIEERVAVLEKKMEDMDRKLDSEFKQLKELIVKTNSGKVPETQTPAS